MSDSAGSLKLFLDLIGRGIEREAMDFAFRQKTDFNPLTLQPLTAHLQGGKKIGSADASSARTDLARTPRHHFVRPLCRSLCRISATFDKVATKWANKVMG